MSLNNVEICFRDDSSPMWIYNVNTLEIIDVNNAALSLYGYSRQEMLSLTVQDLHSREDNIKLPQVLESEVDEAEKSGVWKHNTKDGDVIYIHEKGCSIRVEDQECKLIVANDVTKQKDIETKLKSRKQILDLITKKLPGTFFIFDTDGAMIRWNEYVKQVTGYSSEEIASMNAIDFFAEEAKPKMSKVIETVIEEGYVEARGRLQGKDGEKTPLLFKASKVVMEGEECVLGIGIDVSNVIEAQRKAEIHQNLLQAIIDQSDSVMYIKDQESNLKFANEKFFKLFGLRDEEDFVKQRESLLDKEKGRKVQKNDEYVRETGNTVRFEEEININGEVKTFLSTKMLLKGVDQYENCIFGISTDITERKKMEQDLQKSLKEKEVLLGEIHHRVKNNLAVISGLMDLEIMGSDNNELERKLKDSQTRVNSIATTHEILYQEQNFSNLDFEKTVKRLVERILDTFDSDVSVKYDIESIDLNINQALPCSLIVNELTTNALKHAFTENNGMIKIKAKDKGDEVHLEFNDDGQGIPDGINLQRSSTLGMQLINTLISQLDGEGAFKTDNGTTFELQFEKSSVKGVGSTMFS
ncbi:PAS domain-containing sensor histidine kinase [Fodinibius saliphilus]|uniref:PAS domain-containing sensor histidine kinase n=1 Tax=Fodinibius saliphilus TaxID=1920650 RepID=UPI001109F1D7|nr:PAS domain S-box protein [Fodinibius saliphilus]